MKCEICKIPHSRTCREDSPLIPGRFQTEKGVEKLIYEKIKDCPSFKAHQWPIKKLPIDNC